MAGFAEIFDVLRQEASASRQMQMQEQQMAMSAMQWQAQRQFQEEGRQRQDVIFALGEVDKTQRENMALNINAGIGALSSLVDLTKSAEKNVSALLDKGFSEDDASQIYNIVSINYGDEGEGVEGSPELAQQMLRTLSSQIATEKAMHDMTGLDASSLSPGFAKGFYATGGEQMFTPFQNIQSSLNILQQVEQEKLEVGKGDYTIDIEGLAEKAVSADGDVVDIDALLADIEADEKKGVIGDDSTAHSLQKKLDLARSGYDMGATKGEIQTAINKKMAEKRQAELSRVFTAVAPGEDEIILALETMGIEATEANKALYKRKHTLPFYEDVMMGF